MSNKKYIVKVPEVWYNSYEVLAESEEDALKKLKECICPDDGYIDYGNIPIDDIDSTVDGFEFSDISQDREWKVSPVESEMK